MSIQDMFQRQVAQKKPGGKRKEKSLGVLAERFCQLSIEMNKDISLNECSDKLKVSRRRIYDVVNVLSSIGLIQRLGKNSYRWKGSPGMEKCLREIRLQDQVTSLITKGGKPRKGESLGALTRQFVKIFLQQHDKGQGPIALAVIRKQVAEMRESGPKVGKNEDDFIYHNTAKKSRKGAPQAIVRRLYDVANILTSLGLIRKVESGRNLKGKKANFLWTGCLGTFENLNNNNFEKNGKNFMDLTVEVEKEIQKILPLQKLMKFPLFEKVNNSPKTFSKISSPSSAKKRKIVVETLSSLPMLKPRGILSFQVKKSRNMFCMKEISQQQKTAASLLMSMGSMAENNEA